MTSRPEQVVPGYEIWRWAEPLAIDALRAVYRHRMDDAAAAEWLARAHGRVWALSAQGGAVDEAMGELEQQIVQLGHELCLIHDGNAAVASEIAETLSMRFRRDLRSLSAHAITLDDMSFSLRQAAEQVA
ncbi:MAG: hypothetical protein K2X10_14680 [Hyphomicrobiales bacterium]|nr:hypothetical protein [Hyphomicrobiales bacterium]